MRYEDFISAWQQSLLESQLHPLGWPTETLGLQTMERRYRIAVAPLGGQDAEPFHVTATLEFLWDALHAARTRTTEEDMLGALFCREDVDRLKTEAPRLRVDVTLRASLPHGGGIPVPKEASLRAWAHEATTRLERTEPLLPEETVREGSGGRLEILGWKSNPELRCECHPEGGVRLSAVSLHGWQALTLPRIFDDPGSSDDCPSEQLDAMFARLKGAMFAWMESLEHLRPKT